MGGTSGRDSKGGKNRGPARPRGQLRFESFIKGTKENSKIQRRGEKKGGRAGTGVFQINLWVGGGGFILKHDQYQEY